MFKSRVPYLASGVVLLTLGCVGKSLTAAGKALVLPDPAADEPTCLTKEYFDDMMLDMAQRAV